MSSAFSSRKIRAIFWVQLVVVLALGMLPTPAHAQSIEWTRQVDTSGAVRVFGVAADASGIYAVGDTTVALPGQSLAGGRDAFVRKYDFNGNELWTRQFGLAQPGLALDDVAYNVATDSTGVYVVGYTTFFTGFFVRTEDAFVRKYDANGNLLWTRQFGTDASDVAVGVAVDSTGVYMGGSTSGTLPGETRTGGNDIFLSKYDANGVLQWARQFGTPGTDTPHRVAVDATGIYVGAQFSGGGSYDVLVRKYDADGRAGWTRTFGSEEYDEGGIVAADASGVYVGGETFGTLPEQTRVGGVDAFIRKFDANGIEQWTRQFGTETADEWGAMAADGSGAYFAGNTLGTFPGQSGTGGGFVRKYDANGKVVWTLQFGSAGRPDALAVDASGVYVASREAYLLKIAATCTYEIVPGVFSLSASERSDFLGVNAPAGCAWTAVSNAPWITLTSESSGSGNGRVRFSVAANTSAASRTGTVTITGRAFTGTAVVATLTFTVVQEGSGCAFSLSPTSLSHGSGVESGTVNVSSPAGCTWTAVSNASWITVTSGSSGSGNGTVAYSVSANLSGSSRSGTLTIAGQTFSVTQAGAVLPTGPTVSDGGVVNNASFAPHPAPLAPGSIAAVFGSNLNNGSSVLFSSFGSDGKLVTSLGGATVAINNIPAPLFYSTPGQLGIQIPFELAGQTSAAIQVTVGGQTSASRTVFLDAVAPGIFTLSQDGRGAAAVLHEDGVTPVTAQSPAKPGEVVVFYATGLGAVTPPLATGAPSSGNQTASNATITIDGIPGEVQFSGAAPGFVGLNQINVRIPPNTCSAPDIPVVLTIGDKQSNSVAIPVSP